MTTDDKRTILTLLLVASSLLAASGCSRNEREQPAHDESIYALRLKAHAGLPDLDVAFRVTPGLAAEPPTELSAQHFAGALAQCRGGLEERLVGPVTLMLGVEGGLIRATHDPERLPNTPEGCLADALGGARLLASSEAPRALTIQFARGVPR